MSKGVSVFFDTLPTGEGALSPHYSLLFLVALNRLRDVNGLPCPPDAGATVLGRGREVVLHVGDPNRIRAPRKWFAKEALNSGRIVVQPLNQRANVIRGATLEAKPMEPQLEVNARLVGCDGTRRAKRVAGFVSQMVCRPLVTIKGLELRFDPFLSDVAEEMVGVDQPLRSIERPQRLNRHAPCAWTSKSRDTLNIDTETTRVMTEKARISAKRR